MKKIGNQTYVLASPVHIRSAHALVGEKEKQGPVGKYFKDYFVDDTFGEKTFEKAERKMLTVSTATAYKFACDVYKAVADKEPTGDLEALSELNALTNAPIPAPLCGIGSRKVLHSAVIDKAQMEATVKDFAKA